MKAVWSVCLGLALALGSVASATTAHADDEKSGRLVSWAHTSDGKVVATEYLRTVDAASGTFFASGEWKQKGGKKAHKRSHLQRTGDKLGRYQRLDGGPKAPGIRIFEWEGQMRLAFLNGTAKPVDLGQLPIRLWDGELLHLVALWGLPSECKSARFAYFDVNKQARGGASVTCTGRKKAVDDKKNPLDINVFSLSGVPGEAKELWVDGRGGLIGAKYGKHTMLRAKYALDGQKEVAPIDDEGEDEEKKAIRDRGVGE